MEIDRRENERTLVGFTSYLYALLIRFKYLTRRLESLFHLSRHAACDRNICLKCYRRVVYICVFHRSIRNISARNGILIFVTNGLTYRFKLNKKVLDTMIVSVISNTLKTTICLIIPHGMFLQNNASIDTNILFWDGISLSVEKNVVL